MIDGNRNIHDRHRKEKAIQSASVCFLHSLLHSVREVKAQRYKSIHLKIFNIQFLIAIITLQHYLRKVIAKKIGVDRFTPSKRRCKLATC